jgi:tRNA G10  N-methylase Trm11
MPTFRSRPAGLRTVLHLAHGKAEPLPERFASDDVRFSEELAGIFVDRLTAPGDVVLDPFAGFGTSVVAAERRGRPAWGIELDADRAAWARTRVEAPERILTADARALDSLPVPPVTLAIASPPYSSPGDPCDALSAYRRPNPGYAAYLAGIREVFQQVAARLTSGGWIVIEVANLCPGREVTTLAWDIARAVGEVVPFAGEVVVEWEPTYGYGYDHSYCLLFAGDGVA